MSDHDADVVAVAVRAMHRCAPVGAPGECFQPCGYLSEAVEHADAILAALTAAGIRCLYVPEDVNVEHGASLVRSLSYGTADGVRLYAIEYTP